MRSSLFSKTLMARQPNRRRNASHSYRSRLSPTALFQLSVDLEDPQLRYLPFRSICNQREDLYGPPNSKLRKSVQNRSFKLRTLKVQNKEAYWELYNWARQSLGLPPTSTPISTPDEDIDGDIKYSDKDSSSKYSSEDDDQQYDCITDLFRSLHIGRNPSPNHILTPVQAEAMSSPPPPGSARSARSGRPSPWSPDGARSDGALPHHGKVLKCFSCLLNTCCASPRVFPLQRLFLDTYVTNNEIIGQEACTILTLELPHLVDMRDYEITKATIVNSGRSILLEEATVPKWMLDNQAEVRADIVDEERNKNKELSYDLQATKIASKEFRIRKTLISRQNARLKMAKF
jgi:hypothetical protein